MFPVDFENLHHAYLLVGPREAARKAVLAFFEAEGVRLLGSPDFFLFEEPLFGVDDARRLSEQAIRRAFTGKKVFLLMPERLTHEAQNALLKTFEEPISDTHFFLALREENLALPTLRSRMQTLRLEAEEEKGDARKFLGLAIKDRLAFVKKFVDREQSLPAFLDGLLLELAAASDFARLEKVYKARLVADDRGALPRLVLEHLAVSL